jgi:hypothetical protein
VKPASPFRFITPLRLVFWGGILCLFDFTWSWTGGREGFKFDLLDDFIGMILVTVGLFRIASMSGPGRVRIGLNFLGGIAVVSSAAALLDHFIFPRDPWMAWVTQLLGLAELGGMAVFAALMAVLCGELGLDRAARSWRTTTILFVLIYGLPLGALYVAGMAYMAANSSFRIDLGPAGLLLLPVFAIPLVHLFVSTSRMRRDAAPIAPPAAAAVQ